jgi:sodium-dependent dicarboxylate transporter 2/3/5
MTAVVMMLPIALAVAGVVVKERDKDPEIQKACKNFATSLLLGVTFAASIGGVSTLVGTVPNMIFKGYMEQSFGIEIGFIEWMKVGSLFMIIMLPIAWLILARVLFDCRKVKASGMAEEIKREISEIGSFSRQELTMLLVFLVTVFFWIGGSYLDEFFSAELDPTIIAVLASLLLFLLPSGLGSGSRMLDAEDVEKIPLSVILIFGGSLSVGGAMVETGVAEWVGEQLNYFSNYPQIMLILIIVILVCVVTEILSNVATIAAFLPIISALAIAVDINPIIFGVATTMAVSCSFMLPSSTPSNTVILAGGYVKISQMAKAGLLLNLFAIIVVTLIAHLVVPQVFDL